MEITEIKIYPVQESGRLKAYATMVFDDCFIEERLTDLLDRRWFW